MIAGSNRVWETVLGGVPSSSWYINSPNLTKQTLADRSFINQLSYSVSISTTAIVGGLCPPTTSNKRSSRFGARATTN